MSNNIKMFELPHLNSDVYQISFNKLQSLQDDTWTSTYSIRILCFKFRIDKIVEVSFKHKKEYIFHVINNKNYGSTIFYVKLVAILSLIDVFKMISVDQCIDLIISKLMEDNYFVYNGDVSYFKYKLLLLEEFINSYFKNINYYKYKNCILNQLNKQLSLTGHFI